MPTVESDQPCLELRPFVRAYAQRKLAFDSALLVGVPARLEQVLEFQFGDPFRIFIDGEFKFLTPAVAVIGSQTHFRAWVEFGGTIESFGIFFQPAGFSQLFRIPMHLLTDVGDDAISLLGRGGRAIWNELGEVSAFQGRVRIIERWLIQAKRSSSFEDDTMRVANHLLASQGKIRIAELARRERLDLRSFERRFKSLVGVPPKTYARIARFQTALDLKVSSPSMTWLEISHALHYHDQMHMVHDFQRMGGDSPGRVLAYLGDMRPGALAASSA